LWLSRKLEEMHLDGAVPIELCLGAPGTFLFDDTQLFWCLRNLLTNAREAGGEDPSAIATTSRIRVRSECVDAWISIYVEDDGPGFPLEDLPNVFDPLYSAKGFGAGLGLPIARKIAQNHGGDIIIASPGPKNTTVVIRFPAET